MENVAIDGSFFLQMMRGGEACLAADVERINALNVFPVPDGDTGTNMKMTLEGGVSEGERLKEKDLGVFSAKVARAMVLSARGNSGVILSQFFKGLSLGFEGKAQADVRAFALAMQSGTHRAYEVVSNPTEGTILTVMREAGEQAFARLREDTSLEEYLDVYLSCAEKSLEKTPELLPVLQKAGVVDSGGAGFILVVKGMYKAVRGEETESVSRPASPAVGVANTSSFNADSVLTWGYCTEFILQLQNAKVDTKNFDLEEINSYLRSVGNSIVSFKDDDLVKVHVHTFDPGAVLSRMRRYGEFVTVKIENMNVQHTETPQSEASAETAVAQVVHEHKKYAAVAVANGEGIAAALKEMGVDEVVAGGQTMNTSTQDFITAFERIDAEYIFVFPNNGNILMAAQAAAENYAKAKVFVVPSKTCAQGFSAVSMLNFDLDDPALISEEEARACQSVNTLEATYSVRDAVIDDVVIKKGDYICLYDGKLLSADPDRLSALKKAFSAIDDLKDKQTMTVFVGKGVSGEETEELLSFVRTIAPAIESYALEGGQDVYGYIIGME